MTVAGIRYHLYKESPRDLGEPGRSPWWRFADEGGDLCGFLFSYSDTLLTHRHAMLPFSYSNVRCHPSPSLPFKAPLAPLRIPDIARTSHSSLIFPLPSTPPAFPVLISTPPFPSFISFLPFFRIPPMGAGAGGGLRRPRRFLLSHPNTSFSGVLGGCHPLVRLSESV